MPLTSEMPSTHCTLPRARPPESLNCTVWVKPTTLSYWPVIIMTLPLASGYFLLAWQFIPGLDETDQNSDVSFETQTWVPSRHFSATEISDVHGCCSKICQHMLADCTPPTPHPQQNKSLSNYILAPILILFIMIHGAAFGQIMRDNDPRIASGHLFNRVTAATRPS